MGSAASTAYTLGQEASGSSSIGAGLSGMASAAGGTARSRLSAALGFGKADESGRQGDRKSVVSGKSVSVRVDLGGSRVLKQKQYNNNLATKQDHITITHKHI